MPHKTFKSAKIEFVVALPAPDGLPRRLQGDCRTPTGPQSATIASDRFARRVGNQKSCNKLILFRILAVRSTTYAQKAVILQKLSLGELQSQV